MRLRWNMEGRPDQRDGCLPDCRGVVLGVRGNCHIPDGGRVGRITSLLYGNGRTKKKWIPFLCDPETPRMGAMALTEPGAGSDVKAIKTRAEKDGNEWVINGRKCFITNGGIADLYVVFARTIPDAGYHGVSAFIVPKGTPGLSGGKRAKNGNSGFSYRRCDF